MTTYHVFDVDGTITEPRKPMDPEFVPIFSEYCNFNNVVLVSGSDSSMIEEQIPSEILEKVKLYTCSGVVGLCHDVDYSLNNEELIESLEDIVENSMFFPKTGNHINPRPGMINFSIVGRNATDDQRKDYSLYDSLTEERKYIVNNLQEKFPDLEFLIGGEISIDISKKGINKSLVAKDLLTFDPKAYIIFYGNQILDGNDYPLAKFIQENKLGHSVQITYPNTKLLIN
jgi:phosphomannomutase